MHQWRNIKHTLLICCTNVELSWQHPVGFYIDISDCLWRSICLLDRVVKASLFWMDMWGLLNGNMWIGGLSSIENIYLRWEGKLLIFKVWLISIKWTTSSVAPIKYYNSHEITIACHITGFRGWHQGANYHFNLSNFGYVELRQT